MPRVHAPTGAAWRAAVAAWGALQTDAAAQFDVTYRVNADAIAPRTTWGTSPAHGMALTDRVPSPDALPTAAAREAATRALAYMGLTPGQSLADAPIDVAFIGSCTHGRIEDLRAAANVLRGHRVHPRLRALVVPGFAAVKAEAEAEGLHEVFTRAGAECARLAARCTSSALPSPRRPRCSATSHARRTSHEAARPTRRARCRRRSQRHRHRPARAR